MKFVYDFDGSFFCQIAMSLYTIHYIEMTLVNFQIFHVMKSVYDFDGSFFLSNCNVTIYYVHTKMAIVNFQIFHVMKFVCNFDGLFFWYIFSSEAKSNLNFFFCLARSKMVNFALIKDM